jgi:hypothetical protein
MFPDKLLFLFITLFLLAACNEEKDSSPFKSSEIVLEVNSENFALNGKVIGNTLEDIFQIDDILIAPLDDEFKKMRENNVKLRIRFSEDVYYSVFDKILRTAVHNSMQPIRYTIGSNSSNVYIYDIREKLRNVEWKDEWANFCFVTLFEKKELISVLEFGNSDYFSNQKLMNDTTYRSSKLKCTQNYMNLSVLFPVKNSDSKYRVVFYETDSILPKVYDLKNEADLLNVLETVRKNENLQSKKDYDWINIFVRDSVDKVMTLNRVEPLIKIMANLGYRMLFTDGGF